MTSSDQSESGEWNVYVLRYNCTGNYYVGTTKEFQKRMFQHWRRSSCSSLPCSSYRNRSCYGFRCYWFVIKDPKNAKDPKDASTPRGVTQGIAEHAEYAFANMIVDEIQNIRKHSKVKAIGGWPQVGNGQNVDGVHTEYSDCENRDGKQCDSKKCKCGSRLPCGVQYQTEIFDDTIEHYLRTVPCLVLYSNHPGGGKYQSSKCRGYSLPSEFALTLDKEYCIERFFPKDSSKDWDSVATECKLHVGEGEQ